ncbi:hypothetical protein [Mangrovicoccus sp. HB161399]|uniref:hypothetical protein n=1 Tax=Mangrovicoccus sp. HB161399 TaxID=2720392 RepID=UPI00155411FB|nr:hypothetical protein [Mangrovicoccus sp. HB161399]
MIVLRANVIALMQAGKPDAKFAAVAREAVSSAYSAVDKFSVQTVDGQRVMPGRWVASAIRSSADAIGASQRNERNLHLIAARSVADGLFPNEIGRESDEVRSALYKCFADDIDQVSRVELSEVMRLPLWPDATPPSPILTWHRGLATFFGMMGTFGEFWLNWYLAIRAGTWTDWDLCRHIALIPDDVWKEGPAAVAEAIQRLIDDRTPLKGEAARRQAESLRKEKQSASLCAEGLARYLDEVIRATKLIRNEGLPEPFEPIEGLAIRLFKVSQEVLSEGPESDAALAKLLQGSAADIAGLVRKLREAEAELARLRTELDEARDDIALKNRCKRCSRLTGSQVDGLKLHGRSSSMRFCGCPAAIASSVAFR